jgi:serine/threonine protein kinase
MFKRIEKNIYFRYMAPEVVLRQIYSEKVDVYSYGILLWQMATDIIPFKGLSRNDFIRLVVKGGVRPPLNMTWPSAFSHLLQDCWNTDPKYRPNFHDIIEKLVKMRKNHF